MSCGKIKEKTAKQKTVGVYFRLKDILNRLRKLEDKTTAEGKVTLICMEKGRRIKICVSVGKAADMAMKQSAADMFGTEKPEKEIIGVEADESTDDGFIMALIADRVNPEEVKLFIEV